LVTKIDSLQDKIVEYKLIIKQIPKKSANTGSFKGFANYILDRKNDGDKILNEYINTTNLPFSDLETNIQYAMDTQSLNQKVQSDKTLHLVISFQEDEPIPQGNLEFKKRVLMVTQKYDLKVNFADPQM